MSPRIPPKPPAALHISPPRRGTRPQKPRIDSQMPRWLYDEVARLAKEHDYGSMSAFVRGCILDKVNFLRAKGRRKALIPREDWSLPRNYKSY